jgi:hypothetical protein
MLARTARHKQRRIAMARYMTFRFDVTSLTERQREVLAGSVIAQSEASDFDYATNQEWADENYPSIKVAEVCHFCGQVVEDGECGGEGEGICTELACVSDFALPGKLSPTYSDDVEAYVRDYCAEHGIEDSLVPYRADGLTYYQQLAYMVREHHDLPQLKVSDHTLHAALPEHNVGDIERILANEINANAFGADQSHHLLDLLSDSRRNLGKEQVRFIKKENQPRFFRVANLRKILEQFRKHPKEKRRVNLR